MKNGIAFAGNLVADTVKLLDAWPEKGMLCNITDMSQGVGGLAANTTADVAIIDPSVPLYCIGLLGDDANGAFIRGTLDRLGIDTAGVQTIPGGVTSFTDVMTLKGSGERTFFHARGVTAQFGPEHIDLDRMTADLLHLGYAMLLDRFDAPDPEYGTVMARTLAAAQARGIKTSIDVVSDSTGKFERVVTPSLRYCDYIILNEVESSLVTHIAVRDSEGRILENNIRDICRTMFSLGVSTLVAIHAPEGGWCMDKSGAFFAEPSVDVPPGYIKGKVGAGDAFCAGMLYGIYKGWDCPTCLRFGGAAAAANMSEPDSISGMKPAAECWAIEAQFRK